MKLIRKLLSPLLCAVLLAVMLAPSVALAAADTAMPDATPEATATPAPTQSPTDAPAEKPEDPAARTMYTKRQMNLYKAKKTSSKVLDKLPVGTQVTVSAYGKNWCEATYDGTTGYLRTKYLSDKAPGPTPDPTPTPGPTPIPRNPTFSIPVSESVSYFVGDALLHSVPVSQVITALVLGANGLGDGYFARVQGYVEANLGALLTDNPSIPPELDAYAKSLRAACKDIAGGMTLELYGKQLNAKKGKTYALFTKSGTPLSVGQVADIEGGKAFVFNELKLKTSLNTGTYFLQMGIPMSSAPNLRALFPEADSLTIHAPIKIAKQSSGGGGGGGGGGSGDKALPVARLLVENMRTEPANPSAGDTFDVVMTLRNTSVKQALRNIQITYTSDDDALRPTSGTNTVYIEQIDADASYELRLTVLAKPDLEASSAKLELAMEFEDKKLTALTGTQSLIIPVKQVQRIQVDDPILPTGGDPIVGDTYTVEMGVFNMGKTVLYNVTVRPIPEDASAVSTGTSYYIGNMESGSSKTAELDLVPLTAGKHNVSLEVTYETVDGVPTKVQKPITFKSSEEDVFNYEEDISNMPEVIPEPVKPDAMAVLRMLPWQVYAVLGGLIVLLFVMIGIGARKKRLRGFEDDEMD
ncbi:MAG: SH3 domain-containing protein [Clostridia bacterium]